MTDIDISNIQDGDYVSVKFNTETYGDFVVSGTAQEVNARLYVASWKVYGPPSDGPTCVVEVLEHRVAEPPVGFFGVADDGMFWARTQHRRWMLINPADGIVAQNYTWEQVVDNLDGKGLMAVTA